MRTETIAALRAQVAALERGSGAGPVPPPLPFGAPELDARLPGHGLALGAVHEVFAGGPAAGHGAAPALFAASVLARRTGPVLWIAARCDLYTRRRWPALASTPPAWSSSAPGTAPCGPPRSAWPSRPGRRRVRARGPTRPRRLAAAATGHGGHGRARLRPAPVAAARRPGAAGALGRRDPVADHRPALTPAVAARPGRARPRPPALAAGAAALPRRGGGQLHRGGSGCAGSSRCSCPRGRPTACAGTATPRCRWCSPWSRARMTAGAWWSPPSTPRPGRRACASPCPANVSVRCPANVSVRRRWRTQWRWCPASWWPTPIRRATGGRCPTSPPGACTCRR